ncbi:hypothetical protein E8E14_009851 [Neopestalotiopsis sp. 37M]|nr:hypothetical protein E8E14_009851 [Neopestalotiopsis sp. 37M]
MTLFEPPSGPSDFKNDYKNKPTWYADYKSEETGMQNPDSYDTNVALAEAHYKWLTNPANGQKNMYANSDWLVVAVMYDPISKWHFASTIPKGPRASLMWGGQGRATKWYAAAKVDGQPLELHAEDGAYFNYEISGQAHITDQANTKPYPAGTIIAAYGHGLKTDTQPEFGPDKMPSCSNSRKAPSCQKVADALGVQYSKDPSADADTAGEAVEEISDNEYGDLTEADIDAILCAEGNGPKRRTVSIKGRRVQLGVRDACSSAPTSTPSCTMQNEDPDQGINTQYCVCDSTRTLPFLTITPEVERTKSCDYTTLPPKDTKRAAVAAMTPSPSVPTITPPATLDQRDLTISNGFGPPTTDTKMCQVCTQVVNNEDSCSSLDNCIKQTGQVTIEAGTSSVHVGTLTGDALYTSVSSALDKICPTPTDSGFASCKTDTVSIGKIPYVSAEYLAHDGELQVSVESSTYNVTSIRNALIMAAAKAAQQAATDKNCYEQKYLVGPLGKRGWSSWLPGFLQRSDIQPPQEEKGTWCNTVGFSGPHYYNPYWKLQENPGATDYMDVHFQFHESSGGDFDCAILEGAAGALAVIAPEFAIGDVGLEEAIGILCEGASQGRRDVNTTLLDMP